MAYETKAVLTALAENIAKSVTLKEAYAAVIRAANVEGMALPSYEEMREQIEELRK